MGTRRLASWGAAGRTRQPHWRDPGSPGRGRCGAAEAVGRRPLGLVFFDTEGGGGARGGRVEKAGEIEGFTSPYHPLGGREITPAGKAKPLAGRSLGCRGAERAALQAEPPSSPGVPLPPTWGEEAGAALPSLRAPAACLAAYFPSWQASRCRQGNACGELFILLKFAVGHGDVGGDQQAAAGTVLFRAPSTCVV